MTSDADWQKLCLIILTMAVVAWVTFDILMRILG